MGLFKLIMLSALLGLMWTCKTENTNIEPDPEIEEIICQQSECWDAAYYVCRDSTYIKLFTRTSGWTGGDATYSVQLPSGKSLWMFGDTFIDQVSENGTRPSFRLINNALVLEGNGQFETFYSGSSSNPQSFAKPPEDNWWYWPADATVANDTLYMFMHAFGNDLGGPWDFYRTSVDLLVMDPLTLEIYENRRLIEQPNISWGAAILEDGVFTYIYGVEAISPDKYAFVARTNANLNGDWEYYSGNGWSSNIEDAQPILNDISEQFSVFKNEGIYYLLTQHHIFGAEIYLYTSTSPYGDFGNKKTIYCAPESGGNIFTYNALAHPNIYQDSLLISYNVNSSDYTDLFDDVNNYRPYFVRVGNWKN